MERNYTFSELFVSLINYWWTNLKDMIDEIVSRRNVPVLVMLSRKMPRFLDWFENVYSCRYNQYDLNLTSLKLTERITELALPFVCFESVHKNREFIILDDAIIHGATLKNISEELYLITNASQHISCIFRLNGVSKSPYIKDSQFENIPVLPQDDADAIIDVIAEEIELFQLPIDMEFPIYEVTGNGLSPKSLFSAIRDNIESHFRRTYHIGTRGDRFSVNLSDTETAGKDNDFGKISFFKMKNKIIAQSISPHIISESSLLSVDSDALHVPMCQQIWNQTTLNIRRLLDNLMYEEHGGKWENLKINFTRSLCVWANYLYSTVTFARNYNNLFGQTDIISVKINEEDLSLLIGSSLASELRIILNRMSKPRNYNGPIEGYVLGIPTQFSPSSFDRDYQSFKFMAEMNSDNVDELLNNIFNYQHYANERFHNPFFRYERLLFGETYYSLWDAMKPSHNETEDIVRLFAWIDNNIDMGYVIPKYERVKSKDKTTYWRRYFHSGIRRRLNSI